MQGIVHSDFIPCMPECSYNLYCTLACNQLPFRFHSMHDRMQLQLILHISVQGIVHSEFIPCMRECSYNLYCILACKELCIQSSFYACQNAVITYTALLHSHFMPITAILCLPQCHFQLILHFARLPSGTTYQFV
jgi:hypothetical protein